MSEPDTDSLWGVARFIVLSALAAGVLAALNHYSAPRIAANRAAAEQATLYALAGAQLPTQHHWQQIDIVSSRLILCDSGQIIRTSVRGYSGNIVLLYRFSSGSSAPEALRVISHAETPGIGDFIDNPEHPFMQQLQREPAPDTLTGATITSRAMLRASQTARAMGQAPFSPAACP